MDEEQLVAIKNRNIFQTNDIMGGTYWLLPDNKEDTKIKLNLTQTKILKVAMAMVNPKERINIDEPPKTYTFSIDEFLYILGIKNSPRLQYTDMPNFLTDLMKSDNFTYRDEKGRWTVIHVFDNAIYDPDKREVIFRFSWSMIDKLSSKEKGNYQSYKLQNVLNFRSLYTVNIYEMFKKELKGRKECDFEVDYDDLRMALDVDENIYPVYYEFKRNVLQKSVDEVNEYKVDLEASYTEKRKGRKIGAICFHVVNKNFKEELSEVAVDKDIPNLRHNIIEPVTNLPISDDEYIMLLNKVDGNVEKLNIIYTDCINKVKNIRSIVALMRDIIDNPNKYKDAKNQQVSMFNNFEQRTYDYDDLEKRLLGWDK